ncbi:putative mitochondrial protein [Senna tora]|uniref:Putative mitochondrial protein n=1 Tax=Senna tora TaxID=362788 RepID=A0A835C5E9_9FABA|nr:putative mitochondrial protein [Senna tora]
MAETNHEAITRPVNYGVQTNNEPHPGLSPYSKLFSNPTSGIRAWYQEVLTEVQGTVKRMADMGSSVNREETQPPIEGEDLKKWKVRAGKVMYVLSVTVEDDILQHIKEAKTPKEAWDTFTGLYARTNDAKLQHLENELLSISQQNMTIGEYFTKVKTICQEIYKLDPHNPITETRMRRIIVHGLRPEFLGLVTATRGWAKEPTLIELENILANQEALDKQMSKATVQEEDKALFRDEVVGEAANRDRARSQGELSKAKMKRAVTRDRSIDRKVDVTIAGERAISPESAGGQSASFAMTEEVEEMTTSCIEEIDEMLQEKVSDQGLEASLDDDRDKMSCPWETEVHVTAVEIRPSQVEEPERSGYEVASADSNLFMKVRGGKIAIVLVYVDYLIITGDDKAEIQQVRANLSVRFQMKELGELKHFLGLEVDRSKEGLFLCQQKYARDLLHKFGMLDCKPIATPMEVNAKLCSAEGKNLEDVTMYRQLVGSLIYLTLTRPDITYVGVVSRFMQSPKKPHLEAVRRILRYVKGTLDYGMFYRKGPSCKLKGYSDADYAGDCDTRRSTTGMHVANATTKGHKSIGGLPSGVVLRQPIGNTVSRESGVPRMDKTCGAQQLKSPASWKPPQRHTAFVSKIAPYLVPSDSLALKTHR